MSLNGRVTRLSESGIAAARNPRPRLKLTHTTRGCCSNVNLSPYRQRENVTPLGGRVFDGGVAVKERDTAIEALIELDLGAREAEAPGLGRDVEAAPLPLHDVVVADDALMDEAADAIQLLGSGPPSGPRVSRRASQAAVVIGHEAAQGLVSRSRSTPQRRSIRPLAWGEWAGM